MLLEPIQDRFGLFFVRTLVGLMTTSGAITLLFYEQNPYLIYGSWQLLGFASTMYIIVRVRTLALAAVRPRGAP